MKDRNEILYYENIILIILILVMILVFVSGFFAYQKLNKVIEMVKVNENNETQLSQFKSLIISLAEVERNAKAYYLTRNDEFLANYHDSKQQTLKQILELENTINSDSSTQVVNDSIITLVKIKIDVVDELLLLENNENVTNELKVISNRIDSIEPKIESIIVENISIIPAVKKKGWLSKKNKDQYKITKDTIFTIKESNLDSLKKTLTKDIFNVKTNQKNKLIAIKNRELYLTEINISYSVKISELLDILYDIEKQKISNKNKKAILIANNSSKVIVGFGILLLVFLISIAFVLTKYIISNRRHLIILYKHRVNAMNLAKSKQNLVANMSHEIRTPLNAIIGFSEQILNSKSEFEFKNEVEIIKKSADYLLDGINNILDNAKMQAGKLELNNAPFNLKELINNTIDTMKILAENKDLKLIATFDTELPNNIIGDKLRFNQILINLIGNAIKYTKEGYIVLNISSENNQLQFEISDTGVGIPEDKLETIFNKFEQALTSETGTGLGLAITKNLITLMKGEIHIQSEVNSGTIITVSIPYIEYTAEMQNNVGNNTSIQKLTKLNILIADDEPFNRMLLMSILKKHDVVYNEATNGEEVLELVNNNNFDIILMDIRMPNMDGFEATERIRKLPNQIKSKIPIIALTAGNGALKKTKCLKSGMNDFLGKPFKEFELIEIINKNINKN